MRTLVEIARFYDPEEAYCASGYLRSCGIETFIQNEHHLTAAPWLRIALGGYGIQVFAEDAQNAKTALEEVRSGVVSKGVNASDTAEDYGSRQNWAWFPLAFLMGFPFVLRYRSWPTLALQTVVAAAFLCTFFLMYFA